MQINNLCVRSLLALTLVAAPALATGSPHALPQTQQVQQAAAQAKPAQASPAADGVVGVRNYTKVDSTIACGGTLAPGSIAALKQAGYKSIVNLRADTEEGANVEEEARAAKEAGLAYIHLPFVASSPDATVVDAFLQAFARPENLPMMLHCGSGGRASMFWAAKRVMIDGWPVEKAMAELPDLSKSVSPLLRTFMLDYFKSHGKTRP